MPTGYTAKIYDGENIGFKEFALTCSRAFGATAHMRDESLDVPLRKIADANTYPEDKLKESREELDKVRSMNDEEIIRHVEDRLKKKIGDLKNTIVKKEKIYTSYQSMLQEAQAWNPPTTEHVALKDFMIQQLEDSIQHDCNVDIEKEWIATRENNLKNIDPQIEREKMIEDIWNNIDYYEQYQKEREDRNKKSNQWIDDLINSLD